MTMKRKLGRVLLPLFILANDAASFSTGPQGPLKSSKSIHSNNEVLPSHVSSLSNDSTPIKEVSGTTTRAGFLAAMVAATAAMPTVVQAIESNDAPATIKPVTVPNSLPTSISLAEADPANTTPLQESISGFVAGASLTTTKTLVKFPLDTATVRLQMPNSDYSIRNPLRLFDGSYGGVTLSLLGNIPGGAVFFAVKDATKAALKESAFGGAPKWAITSVAVAAAQIPYWLIRNPSEVIKVRQQCGIDGYGPGTSAWTALQNTLASNNSTKSNVEELYTGYWENIAYAFPADVFKFVAYDTITQGKKNLSPVEGAAAGAVATAMAQFVTTPLDVVRNRLMTGKTSVKAENSKEETSEDTDNNDEGYVGSLVTIAKNEGLPGLFAGATPRVGKAFLSGAIQFATYEDTKQKISKMFQR